MQFATAHFGRSDLEEGRVLDGVDPNVTAGDAEAGAPTATPVMQAVQATPATPVAFARQLSDEATVRVRLGLGFTAPGSEGGVDLVEAQIDQLRKKKYGFHDIIISLAMPFLFIFFYIKFGPSWGEGRDSKVCQKNFPLFVLVNGIAGGTMFLFVYMMSHDAKSGVLNRENAASRFRLWSLLQSLALGWWIYGQVLLFDSKRQCGEEMYDLVFVLFWIFVSGLGLVCCGICCLASIKLTDM